MNMNIQRYKFLYLDLSKKIYLWGTIRNPTSTLGPVSVSHGQVSGFIAHKM